MEQLVERFVNYTSFDTQSKPGARNIPSTEGQLKLAKVLKSELTDLGLKDITLNKNGYLMATLPSNVDWKVPTIGFIAHLDTSPEMPGKDVTPQVIEGYRGGDIALGIGDVTISPVKFSVLHKLIGYTIITADGNTLLGADNKAGIAEIITAVERLQQLNIPHGDIRIAFTPDEEVGKGATLFDVNAFGAEWAYTVDGGAIGELEYENFNAASVLIKIAGNNTHPGTAKGIMVNSLALAAKFHQELPADETPECTEGYEGFYHLTSVKGNVEYAEAEYIIRDFTMEGFEQRKQKIAEIVKKLNKTLPVYSNIKVAIEDSYYNMREEVMKHPHVVELAKEAMQACKIDPIIKPIRGGTDGAHLSFKSLPCPNIFTGGYNFHSKHEFITLEGMISAVMVIMKISELAALKSKDGKILVNLSSE